MAPSNGWTWVEGVVSGNSPSPPLVGLARGLAGLRLRGTLLVDLNPQRRLGDVDMGEVGELRLERHLDYAHDQTRGPFGGAPQNASRLWMAINSAE